MLVHEASARFKDRPPTFGDEKDVLAVVTLGLHSEAVTQVTATYRDPEFLEARLQELQQMDAPTLEAFLHSIKALRKRRANGRSHPAAGRRGHAIVPARPRAD